MTVLSKHKQAHDACLVILAMGVMSNTSCSTCMSNLGPTNGLIATLYRRLDKLPCCFRLEIGSTLSQCVTDESRTSKDAADILGLQKQTRLQQQVLLCNPLAPAC